MNLTQCANVTFALLLTLHGPATISVGQDPRQYGPLRKPNSHIKTKYDKSKNVTTVTLKAIAVSGAMASEVTALGDVPQLTLEVFFTHAEEHATKPIESVTFRFVSRSRFPVFQRSQNLLAVVDENTAIPLGSTAYKSNAETFYTDEIMEATLANTVMKRITSVKKLELFLGNRKIVFRNAWLDDLRDLSALMTPSASQ